MDLSGTEDTESKRALGPREGTPLARRLLSLPAALQRALPTEGRPSREKGCEIPDSLDAILLRGAREPCVCRASSRLSGSAEERGWQEGWPTGRGARPVRRGHQGFPTDAALHMWENGMDTQHFAGCEMPSSLLGRGAGEGEEKELNGMAPEGPSGSGAALML